MRKDHDLPSLYPLDDWIEEEDLIGRVLDNEAGGAGD